MFFRQIALALESPGGILIFLWAAILAAALAAVLVTAWNRRRQPPRPETLFAGAALLLGIPAYYEFLQVLGYPTQPWYYLSLLAFIAILVEPCFAAWESRRAWRITRLAAVAAVFLAGVLPMADAARTRQTNINDIARLLESRTAPGDLVVVTPWFLGVSFDRYYRGTAPWTTLPALAEHRIHRYDLLKQQMASPDPLRPLLDTMASVLRAGGSIWIVGGLNAAPPGLAPPILAPAPDATYGWDEAAYTLSWSMQASFFLQSRVTRVRPVELPPHAFLNRYENIPLTEISGWRTP